MTIAARARQAAEGRFRTLIVGAGIAGLTLAALLDHFEVGAAIVERSAASRCRGYNLGLYPVGSRVLHGLGLYREFVETSTPLGIYQLWNGVGQQMQQADLAALFDRYGPICGLRRAELIDLLASRVAADRMIFEATVTDIGAADGAANVTFSDGSVGAFDLVVGADGINSRVRELILPEGAIHAFDTGWACLVSPAPAELLPAETVREYWGAGFMIGLYPYLDGIGVVLAGPAAPLAAAGRHHFIAALRTHLREPVATTVLDIVERDPDPFLWPLRDVRADQWVAGRTVLLGDAADAFLPTAGVGASMAMLSAAALADELSRSDAACLPAALRLYQRRQQPKVIAAQQNSRKLAQLMMVKSPVMAWGREQLMHFYGPDRALADIIKVMDGIV
jgi:2-polyprenyl-6-methoxyphenol hydroxylase-like FAD-dependent oxidoreductase